MMYDDQVDDILPVLQKQITRCWKHHIETGQIAWIKGGVILGVTSAEELNLDL